MKTRFSDAEERMAAATRDAHLDAMLFAITVALSPMDQPGGRVIELSQSAEREILNDGRAWFDDAREQGSSVEEALSQAAYGMSLGVKRAIERRRFARRART